MDQAVIKKKMKTLFIGQKSLYTAKPLSDKQAELDVVLAENEG